VRKIPDQKLNPVVKSKNAQTVYVNYIKSKYLYTLQQGLINN